MLLSRGGISWWSAGGCEVGRWRALGWSAMSAPTKSAYLDHAATTPMVAEAIEAMTRQLMLAGNASSLHAAGRSARRIVEESRETIAQALGARPSEVIFTSGGTESDNLAVKGLFWARRAADPRRVRVLASAVEHHAVLDAVEWLEVHEGAEAVWLEVDAAGRVRPETVRAAIAEDPDAVALVTVMWANNEVGTVSPIAEIAAIAHEYGVPVHCDAVQAIGQLPVDFGRSGLDALSLAGHKIGGPLGVGALLAVRELALTPLVHGGGQEREVRSGTLDTPAIAGLAAAVGRAVACQPAVAQQLAALRDELIARVSAAVPDAVLNGGHPARNGEHQASLESRLPGNAHFSFPGCEGDALLMLLDARGVECSTGSACTAGVARPSHVLLAMGASEELARATLRFSLGHTSTQADVDALLAVLPAAVERARRAGLVSASSKR
jgi:cysteine desulfurase